MWAASGLPFLLACLLPLTAHGFLRENVRRTALSDAKHDPAFKLTGEQNALVQDLTRKLAKAQSEVADLKAKLAAASAPTLEAGKMIKREKPYFCPNGNADMPKWKKRLKELEKTCDMCGSRGPPAGPIAPTYWCDKLQNNIKPWVKPKLTTDDVAIGIFTGVCISASLVSPLCACSVLALLALGESLFYGRASATRDTWLLQFRHHYIFSAKSEPRIPVIGLQDIPQYKKYDWSNERLNAQVCCNKHRYQSGMLFDSRACNPLSHVRSGANFLVLRRCTFAHRRRSGI